VLWIAVKYWNFGTELVNAGDAEGAKKWIENALGLGEFCSGYEQIENVRLIDLDEKNISATFCSIKTLFFPK
jgi:hypothetical protein